MLLLVGVFFADFHFLLAKFLFEVYVFGECHESLALRDKQVTQICTLLSVHKLTNRYAVANHQQSLKEVMQEVTDHEVHLLFV